MTEPVDRPSLREALSGATPRGVVRARFALEVTTAYWRRKTDEVRSHVEPLGDATGRRPRLRAGRASKVRLAAVCLGLALCGSGVAVVTSAVPAYGDVATSTYSIEAPASGVSDVVASPGVVVAGAVTSFNVKFRVTVALSGSSSGTWVSVTPSSPLGSSPVSVRLVDEAAPTCSQAGAGAGAVGAAAVTVDLGSACSLAAGDDLEVGFIAKSPRVGPSFYFSVTTSANRAPATSSPVTTSSSPPAFSATSQSLGAHASYAVTDASWSAFTLSQSFTVLLLNASATVGSAISWDGATAGYSAIVTSPGGATAPDVVQSVNVGVPPGLSSATIVLASPVAAGDSLSITAQGTNPATTSSDQVSVVPETFILGGYSVVGPTETTNALLFGTSVSGVTVTESPPVGGAEATYAVGFQATDGVSGGPGASICLGEMAGPTNFSTETAELVTDTTAGWHFAAAGTSYPAGNPPANPGCDAFDNGAVIAVPLGYDIRAGDTLSVVLVNVTNPPAGTIRDFAVSTSSDTVGARAAPYAIALSASPGVLVSVNPATTGSLATYTISGIVASAAMEGGSATITIEGPAGTVFPNDPAYYGIEDLTTASGSGTVTAPVSGGGTSTATIVVPAGIHASDHLVITVQDAVNPASASTGYSVSLLGALAGQPGSAPFPHANLTYPNGAIVGFSGTDYVLAGGHAFGVPTPSALASLETVDHAEPQTAPGGAAPPDGPPRSGTLVSTRSVTGDPTVYVAGADGELHGFATPSQLFSEGYDTALVVTVPSLGGVVVGTPAGQLGSAADALSTSSDGALVVSDGAWYVLAGGRAFPVASTFLATLRRQDRAKALPGVVKPAEEVARVAPGVLLSAPGRVYVSYEGELWTFKSPSQLASDGYGGTAAVPVPTRSGLTVVGTYGGS